MKTVTAAIIIRNGKVLICRRKKALENGGLWEFPGGKLEDGESLQECLERELYEELGVRAQAGEILGESVFDYDHGKIKLVGIITSIRSSSFKLTDHDKTAWVKVDKLSGYDLASADIPLALKLLTTDKY